MKLAIHSAVCGVAGIFAFVLSESQSMAQPNSAANGNSTRACFPDVRPPLPAPPPLNGDLYAGFSPCGVPPNRTPSLELLRQLGWPRGVPNEVPCGAADDCAIFTHNPAGFYTADDFSFPTVTAVSAVEIDFAVSGFPGDPTNAGCDFYLFIWPDTNNQPGTVDGPVLQSGPHQPGDGVLSVTVADTEEHQGHATAATFDFGGEVFVAQPSTRYWIGMTATPPPEASWLGAVTSCERCLRYPLPTCPNSPYGMFQFMPLTDTWELVEFPAPFHTCSCGDFLPYKIDMAFALFGPVGGGETVLTIGQGPAQNCTLRLTPSATNQTVCNGGACPPSFGPSCVACVGSGCPLPNNQPITGLSPADVAQRLAARFNAMAAQCSMLGGINGAQAVGPRLIVRSGTGPGAVKPKLCLTVDNTPKGVLGGVNECTAAACNLTFQIGPTSSQVFPPISAGTDHFTTTKDCALPQADPVGTWFALDLPAGFFDRLDSDVDSSPINIPRFRMSGVARDFAADDSDVAVQRCEDIVFGRCSADFAQTGSPNGVFAPDAVVDALDTAQYNFCRGQPFGKGDCARFDFDGNGRLDNQNPAGPAGALMGDAAVFRCLFETNDNSECCPGNLSLPQEASSPVRAELTRLHLRSCEDLPVERTGASSCSERWVVDAYLSPHEARINRNLNLCQACIAGAKSEPNHVIATADNLGLLGSTTCKLVAGSISHTGCDAGAFFPGDFDADVYRFSLAFPDTVNVNVIGRNGTGVGVCGATPAALASVWVYDDGGVLLGSNDPVGTADAQLSIALPAGVYYVLVAAASQGDPPNPDNVMCSVTSEPLVDGGATDPTGAYQLSLTVAPASRITVRQTFLTGGTFDSHLLLQPLLTFQQVCDPFHAIVLDTGALDEDAVFLEASGIPWTRQLDPTLPIIPGDADFVPGVAGLPGGQMPVATQHSDSLADEHAHRVRPPLARKCPSSDSDHQAITTFTPNLVSDIACGSWRTDSGTLVWLQPFAVRSDNIVGLFSDLDAGTMMGREAADSFVLFSNSTVTDIHWRGGYNVNHAPAASADDFAVTFYADDNGRPGALVAAYDVGNTATRSPGQLSGDPGRQIFEYSYNLAPTLAVNADTILWVSVVNDTTGASYAWFFGTAAGGDSNGAAASRDIAGGSGYWAREINPATDFSFDITVSGNTTVISGDSVDCTAGGSLASGLGYRFDSQACIINGYQNKVAADEQNRWRAVRAPWKMFDEFQPPNPIPVSQAGALLAQAGITMEELACLTQNLNTGTKLVRGVFRGLAAYDAEPDVNGVGVTGRIERTCNGAAIETADPSDALSQRLAVRGIVWNNNTATFLTGEGDAEPAPRIVHESTGGALTTPCSGYVDPRIENLNSTPPLLHTQGLNRVWILFDQPVFAMGGGPVGPGSFVVTCTGAMTEPCPTIAAVMEISAGENPRFELMFGGLLPLQTWTTVRAVVQNADGVSILNLGDLGPGMNEPDRMDYAAHPGNVDQNNIVAPLDLLRFRQFVNNNCPVCPSCGGNDLYFDIDRNGVFPQPLDLLRLRQIFIGAAPATRCWSCAPNNVLPPRP